MSKIEGWKEVELSEIINIKRGFAFKASDYVSNSIDSIVSYRVTNIGEASYSDSDKVFLPKDFYESYKDFQLFPKDILLVMVGATTGKVGVVPQTFRKILHNQNSWKIEPKKNDIDKEFLSQGFSLWVKKHLAKLQGGARDFLSSELLYKELVSVPSSLDEQKKIAEILTSVDLLIELTSIEIDKLKDLKKGMIQELFTKGIGHTKFKDSLIGQIPESWELFEIGQVLIERLEPIDMDDLKEYVLVKAKRDFKGIVFREKFFGKQVLVKKQFIIREKDFIISKRQIVHGGCGLVPAELDGAIVSNEYNIFVGSKKLDIEYFNFLSQTQLLIGYSFDCSHGVIIEKLLFKTNQWLKCLIPLPKLDEQKKIIATLKSIEQKIIATECKLVKLTEIKNGLMNDLLTGKLRVGC